eukprot:7181633-Prymnesium_polylepis.1
MRYFPPIRDWGWEARRPGTPLLLRAEPEGLEVAFGGLYCLSTSTRLMAPAGSSRIVEHREPRLRAYEVPST